MTCTQCHAENVRGAQKCAECGAPLAAYAPQVSSDDEFELQPVEAKPVREQNIQGPPRIDLDNLDAEEEAKKGTLATGEKKPKKAIPERPEDYKQQSKMVMIVLAASLLLPLSFNLFGQVDYCGHGLPNIIGMIFGGLAMLESMKVDEFYKAADYEGALKASLDAKRWIKIAWIAAIVAFVFVISIQVVWLVMHALTNVVAPKMDVQ